MNKYYLPIVEKLTITNYSLYKCPLEIDLSKKLNIVYGTNGTGKSTLLMMILFSIVGPYKGNIKTKVRQDQRRDNRPIYEGGFFSNRVPILCEDSKVTAKFTINHDRFLVTHSLKDGKLLSAKVNDILIPGSNDILYKTYEEKYTKSRKEESSTELKNYLIYHYQEQLKKSTKLPGGVNTLISMMLDIMFFDERREEKRLTFWNDDLQETIIGKYIVDAEFYEEYCERKLTTKALESAYKKKSETLNYMSKFFAKEEAERKKEMRRSGDNLQEERISLEEKLDRMEESLKEDQSLYSQINNNLLINAHDEEKIKDNLAELDASWYKNLFPSQYEKYHHRFSKQMEECVCPLCGSNHVFSISTKNCIMCGEELNLNKSQDIISIDIARKDCYSNLMRIRANNTIIKSELSEIGKRIEIMRRNIDNANVRLNEIQALLNPDDDHSKDSDRKRLDRARSERNEALEKYNSSKRKEENMKKIIEENLVENFSIFKSSFVRYASSFFGPHHKEDLSLPFSDDNLSSPLMKFELDGKPRDVSDMLSESQRIFTDLSFRFSVLTTFHDKSFFICETPDSTLDQFHEEQAVKTFLEYITNGNSLIISANARKSNLVATLYQEFKPQDVTIVDLTKISQFAMPNQYSFDSYIKER